MVHFLIDENACKKKHHSSRPSVAFFGLFYHVSRAKSSIPVEIRGDIVPGTISDLWVIARTTFSRIPTMLWYRFGGTFRSPQKSTLLEG